MLMRNTTCRSGVVAEEEEKAFSVCLLLLEAIDVDFICIFFIDFSAGAVACSAGSAGSDQGK